MRLLIARFTSPSGRVGPRCREGRYRNTVCPGPVCVAPLPSPCVDRTPDHIPLSSCRHRPGAYVHNWRSEEHTSELQSRLHLVCRLLLEKKKKNIKHAKVSQATRQRHVYAHTHS